MTNREWLNTLPDEDFASWCCNPDNFVAGEFIEPSPKLDTIKFSYNSSYEGLKLWLGEERIEK